MTSSRLPGKVLADLGGRPVLRFLLDRLSRAKELDQVIVATSTHESDDPVARAALAAGVSVARGPLDDVLERFRQAAAGGAIVRITGDCPLIDPAVVDFAVGAWRRATADYVANVPEPRTFPDGLDVEVISLDALVAAAAEATDSRDREHVTPFIIARPERFPQLAIDLVPACPEIRITLDTAEDLALLRETVDRLGGSAGTREIVAHFLGAVGECRFVLRHQSERAAMF